MIKKIVGLLSVSLVLSGCTLLPGVKTPITGSEAQKAEKLAQIIASGGTAVCQIKNIEDNTETQITVKGKKMRFVGTEMGEGKDGVMINDGVYTYIWSEGEKTGIKTKIVTPTPTEVTGENVAESETETEKYEDETKYKMECTGGGVDDSAFVPPADVVFTDYSAMMEQTRQQVPQGIPSIPVVPNVQY